METEIEKLQRLRILPSDDIPPHEFLYEWQGKPCFARGELVALTGKAKSGKTYVCSMLMTLAEQGQFMGMRRPRDEPYRIVWIDTEQSEDTTQEILCLRMGALLGHTPDENRFLVYNLRQLNWQERMTIVADAICMHKPDLVIFDGIRDVVSDINDYAQAQDVMTKLLSLASYSHACIVCVLHQNKAAEDKTLRGALGTELQNKSFETYECQKDLISHQFTLRQTATRKYDIYNDMTFMVNAEGLPYLVNSTSSTTTEATKTAPSTFNPNFLGTDGRLNTDKLLRYILPEGKQMSREQLRAVMMKAGGIYSPKFADTLMDEAVRKQMLTESQQDGSTYYAYPYQTTMVF